MNTIEQIEKVFAALQAVKDAGGRRASANIDNVSMDEVLSVCEHYGIEPTQGRWWMATVRRNDVVVAVFSEEIVSMNEGPKVSALDVLRKQVATRSNNAAA